MQLMSMLDQANGYHQSVVNRDQTNGYHQPVVNRDHTSGYHQPVVNSFDYTNVYQQQPVVGSVFINDMNGLGFLTAQLESTHIKNVKHVPPQNGILIYVKVCIIHQCKLICNLWKS